MGIGFDEGRRTFLLGIAGRTAGRTSQTSPVSMAQAPAFGYVGDAVHVRGSSMDMGFLVAHGNFASCCNIRALVSLTVGPGPLSVS